MHCENLTRSMGSKNVNSPKVIGKNVCYKILKKYVVSQEKEVRLSFCQEVRTQHDAIIHPSFCEEDDYYFLTNDMVKSVNFALRFYKNSLFEVSKLRDQLELSDVQNDSILKIIIKPKRIRRTFKELEEKKAHFCFYKNCKKAFTTRKA